MSPSPIARSHDLARLTGEGYDLVLLGGMLLVRGLPYVRDHRLIDQGTLVVPLKLRGDVTAAPTEHLVSWIGDTPRDVHGETLRTVVQWQRGTHQVAGLETTHTLCIKPSGREFVDYHELVGTYARTLGMHAEAISPGVMDRFGPQGRDDRSAAVPIGGPPPWNAQRRRSSTSGGFRYADTASSRAGTDALNALLSKTVGIVGLGGTGSHVLDLVAKTSVGTIHLYDDDVFEQHSAFRTPGASSLADVGSNRRKVELLAARYAAMRTGVVPHAVRLDVAAARLLDDLDFCFVCIDDGVAKGPILDRLTARSIPWVDVGMGLSLTPEGIVGAVRTTVGLPGSCAEARSRIPCGPPVDDGYASNVQTCDLNALNAALAVVEWKRLCGFYASDRALLSSVLVVGSGMLHEEERP